MNIKAGVISGFVGASVLSVSMVVKAYMCAMPGLTRRHPELTDGFFPISPDPAARAVG
jgi:hypothetical protein